MALRWWIAAALMAVLARGAVAAPIPVRYAESVTQGWVEVTDVSDKVLGHGELTQWLERGALGSRLLLRFDDGSVYDERLRFSQRGVFRLLSYRLAQHGPSFTTESDVQFDRSGRYQVRQRKRPDGKEETASGTTDVPDDLCNGMMSTLLRNLPSGGVAIAHLLVFTPKPHVLDVHFSPEGTDTFAVGKFEAKTTRFLVEPKVTGVLGAVTTVIGKQPPNVRYWLTSGRTPVFLRFEGPLYADGPTWRIQQTAPRLRRR